VLLLIPAQIRWGVKRGWRERASTSFPNGYAQIYQEALSQTKGRVPPAPPPPRPPTDAAPTAVEMTEDDTNPCALPTHLTPPIAAIPSDDTSQEHRCTISFGHPPPPA
jgi:hypothetical protein